jgi:tetratricopeptide (TPR) repeat protein
MRPATPRSLRRLPRQRLTCGAVTVLFLTAACPSAGLAQQENAPTVAWKLAVQRHTPGKSDAALETVATIPYWRIPHALRRSEVAEDRHFLTRALVLHTDLAIVQRQAAERRGDAGARSGSMLLEDGQSAGRRQGSPHWSVALQIATMLADRRDPEARRIALLWFRAVNGLFLHWAEGTQLYVDTGLRYFPDDAVLHLYRGTVHQMYANGRVQQSLNRPDPAAGYAPGPSADPRLREAASVELARAETALRRALELDPDLAEARIRLAHVVGDRGHPDEAVALVKEALCGSLPPFFESYATLVLGRNLARVGSLEDARAAFDRAATLAPTAQAPRIGRSQVALAAGRPADALRALTDGLGPEHSVPTAAEEWAIYYRVHDPVAAVQLAALRSEVP